MSEMLRTLKDLHEIYHSVQHLLLMGYKLHLQSLGSSVPLSVLAYVLLIFIQTIKEETDGLHEELEFIRILGADLIFACGETEKPEVKKSIDEVWRSGQGLQIEHEWTHTKSGMDWGI